MLREDFGSISKPKVTGDETIETIHDIIWKTSPLIKTVSK
jgi:hypothetical protein